jgi:RNA polymerase sigma-70 factor (ECF subfamily)
MKGENNFPEIVQDEAPGKEADRDAVLASRWQVLLTHQELIFRICLGLCRDAADADDMAQETYCKAFALRGKLVELNDDEHVKLWLCRVARTTCLDHLRREKLRSFFPLVPEERSGTAIDPEALLLHSEKLSLFHAALTRLPRQQREALVLREFGQLSYREIALLLGIKEGTLMSVLLRARRRVSAAVKEALHE